jgi:transposase
VRNIAIEYINDLNLNTATFVGIDAHSTEHTALAMNRFEEEKGMLRFENTIDGIAAFLHWLPTLDTPAENVVIGVEGSGGNGHALVSHLIPLYEHVYEVNPLYTKQRRTFSTRGRKSDPLDAKLIAEVLTRKLPELPKLTRSVLSSRLVSLKKPSGFMKKKQDYGTRLKNQLQRLKREHRLCVNLDEKRILSLTIREKQNELRSVKRVQKKLMDEMSILLKGQGENLTTMIGISTITAAKLVARINGIERFQNISKFLQYAGIAPKEKSSGKVKRHVQNNKGNRSLNSTFYWIALNQVRWHAQAKAYFDKKLKEGKTKKHALRCVMKRVACIVYGMLKSGEEYRG